MGKKRDYIKLAIISFTALLIFAASLFLVLAIILDKLKPPFSATLLPAVTPSVGPHGGGLTSTVTKSRPIPEMTGSVPSQTNPAVPSQTTRLYLKPARLQLFKPARLQLLKRSRGNRE